MAKLRLPGNKNNGSRPGRNDPCPCGSGLKFKKCHLAREGTQPRGIPPVPWHMLMIESPNAICLPAAGPQAEKVGINLNYAISVAVTDLGSKAIVMMANGAIINVASKEGAAVVWGAWQKMQANAGLGRAGDTPDEMSPIVKDPTTKIRVP